MNFPPVFVLLTAVILWPLLCSRTRAILLVGAPLVVLTQIPFLREGTEWTVPFLLYEVSPFVVDPLRLTFGLAFALVTVVAAVYAFHHKDPREQAAGLLYAAGAQGVVFAGDLLSLVIFWELMAVASTFIVWRGGRSDSSAVGFRYLIMHLLGGSLLLGGILFHFAESGSLAVEALSGGWTVGKTLMLAGILVNAGMPPLHTWIPDAYPKGTVTGSVFLSAFSTKTAVFALAVLFPGWEVLLYLGIVMTLWGVYYAVLANDIRLILAYHIISQVGYMVAAIGAGGDIGINAASAHAFNNLMYKTLMFMAAGCVLYTVGKTKLTDLGGLAPQMKWVVLLYLIGGASISGFPLFNGFVSKAMILESAKFTGGYGAYYLLVFAAIGTFLSVGIKLPYYTWFYKAKEPLQVQRPIPKNMFWAMGVLAFFCIAFGYEGFLYQILPFAMSGTFYTTYNVVEVLQLSLFTFVVFWYFRHGILGKAKIVLDVDWFYRRSAPVAKKVFIGGVNRFFSRSQEILDEIVAQTCRAARNPFVLLKPREEDREYSPDRYRAGLGMSVLLTTLSLVVLLVWVYF